MTSTVLTEQDCPAGSNSLILKTTSCGHVRTPAARREALLAEFDRSGLSGKQFAQLSGIKYSTFQYWLQRRKRGANAPSLNSETERGHVAWLEAVVQQGPASGGTGLMLQLPGGVRAEIASPQHIDLAAALVRALEKPC